MDEERLTIEDGRQLIPSCFQNGIDSACPAVRPYKNSFVLCRGRLPSGPDQIITHLRAILIANWNKSLVADATSLIISRPVRRTSPTKPKTVCSGFCRGRPPGGPQLKIDEWRLIGLKIF